MPNYATARAAGHPTPSPRQSPARRRPAAELSSRAPVARSRRQSRQGGHVIAPQRPPLLASFPAEPRQRPGHRLVHHSWSQPPVFVRSPGRARAPFQMVASNLTVNISARPYGVKTFVYMDGGRELGIAPLRVRFDRPGRHKLLFMAPDLGPSGRVNRTIE